jgi:hypothetical protein
MDPWIEQEGIWVDFHAAFIPALRRQLAQQVLPRYIVLMEEQASQNEGGERRPNLEIRDGATRQPVTVVELLNPSNKRRGEDRGKDLDRRRAVLRGTAHFVEIDLLRGDSPMPLIDRPRCDYSVLVSRAERRPEVDFWPIDLRDRLPVVPIPLRSPDGDARVDLKAALDQVYDDAGYAHFIYQGTPSPPLSPDDAKWAASFLPATS